MLRIYMCMCVYIYIYIYIRVGCEPSARRAAGRAPRPLGGDLSTRNNSVGNNKLDIAIVSECVYVCVYIYIYIYDICIYIYIYMQRERERERDTHGSFLIRRQRGRPGVVLPLVVSNSANQAIRKECD